MGVTVYAPLSHQEVVASRVRAQVLPFNHMMCYWHGMTLNQVFLQAHYFVQEKLSETI